MVASVLQEGYRIRTDHTAAQGGTPVWAAAQNTDAVIPANIPFRVRFLIVNGGAGGIPSASTKYVLQYAKNGGAYQTGSDLAAADATFGVTANGQQITTGLLSAGGAGIFSPIGQYCSSGTTVFAISIPYGDYLEFEFGLQFISPMCDGNMYVLQVTALSGSDNFTSVFAPTFALGHSASLTQTEADDQLTGAGNVPRAARLGVLEVSDNLTAHAIATSFGALAVTEANDVLAGRAFLTVTGVLGATESNDALSGAAVLIPIGGLEARLTATETNDAMTGLGSVTGVVGAVNVIEDNDSMNLLVAALNRVEDNDSVVSATLLWANQWIEAEDCPPSLWTPVDCGSSFPTFPPPDGGGGGGGEVTTVMELMMEQLPVLSVNQIGAFSHTPNMELCTLTVDGRPFFPVGSPVDFSVSGTSITWLNTTFSVVPGSIVIAQYSWTSNG